MPTAPILCLGARWKAEDVIWRCSPRNGQLLGVRRTAKRSAQVNFFNQTGVYVLYSDFSPIYVGQANKSLFARLQTHYLSDDLAGRWDRFTWFGFRRVVGSNPPKLSAPGVDFHISTKQLLDHLEAVMIHAFEPSLNGQEGRFGQNVVRYVQMRDNRLGPIDRDLLVGMALKGDLLPEGKRYTKRGWIDE